MTDIPTFLRAAADDPPPTSIDLDRIIAGERRRGAVLRVAGAAGGATAAVLAVLVGATLLTSRAPDPVGFGFPGSSPAVAPLPPSRGGTSAQVQGPPDGIEPSADVASGAPMPCDVVVKAPRGAYQSFAAQRPDPTEPPGDAGRRMTADVLAAISGLLPHAQLRDTGRVPGCAHPLFVYQPDRRTFTLTLELTDPQGRSLLGFSMLPRPTELQSDLCSIPGGRYIDAEPSCRTRQVPGTGGTGSAAISTGSDGSGRQFASVLLTRGDGTLISALASNLADGQRGPVTRPALPLTGDQLLDLLLQSNLTLYP